MEWQELSEGMPLNKPCIVEQNTGNLEYAAAFSEVNVSGIMLLKKSGDKFITTSTFLMKVNRFMILEK